MISNCSTTTTRRGFFFSARFNLVCVCACVYLLVTTLHLMSVPFPAAAEFRHLLDDVCMALFQSITEARRNPCIHFRNGCLVLVYLYLLRMWHGTRIHSIYFNISLRDWIAPAQSDAVVYVQGSINHRGLFVSVWFTRVRMARRSAPYSIQIRNCSV